MHDRMVKEDKACHNWNHGPVCLQFEIWCFGGFLPVVGLNYHCCRWSKQIFDRKKTNMWIMHAIVFSVALSRHGTYFYILGTCQRTVNHIWQSCMFGNMNQTNCRIENNRHKPEHIHRHRHRYGNRRHTCTNMQIHPPHPQHLPHPHTPKLEHTCTETNKHPPPHRSIPYTSRHCVLRSWSSKNSLFGVATSVQFGSCGAGAWIGNDSKTMVESWNLPLSWLGPKGLAPAAPWGMSTPMAASAIPSSEVVISKIYIHDIDRISGFDSTKLPWGMNKGSRPPPRPPMPPAKARLCKTSWKPQEICKDTPKVVFWLLKMHTLNTFDLSRLPQRPRRSRLQSWSQTPNDVESIVLVSLCFLHLSSLDVFSFLFFDLFIFFVISQIVLNCWSGGTMCLSSS